jgi:hypothetical protein
VSQPSGQIWVNPEGVTQLGDNYGEHGALYQGYLDQLQLLRAQYGNSWGDDDMGKQFSEKFLKGLDALDGMVTGVKETLDYTSAGLRESGKAYRLADDDARDTGHKLARDFEGMPQGAGLNAYTAGEAQEAQPAQKLLGRTRRVAMSAGEVREAEPAQRLRGRLAVRAEPVEPVLRSEKNLQTGQDEQFVDVGDQSFRLKEIVWAANDEFVRKDGNTRLVSEGVDPETGEPKYTRISMDGKAYELEPQLRAMMSVMPAQEAQAHQAFPAISSYRMTPEYATALVDGRPLAEGYHLQALNRFPDGTTRVDANLFESIAPVVGSTVTGADGQPLDPGDDQFFVVKENPAADATAENYQPLIVSFTPDGTAVPLVTDLY